MPREHLRELGFVDSKGSRGLIRSHDSIETEVLNQGAGMGRVTPQALDARLELLRGNLSVDSVHRLATVVINHSYIIGIAVLKAKDEAIPIVHVDSVQASALGL